MVVIAIANFCICNYNQTTQNIICNKSGCNCNTLHSYTVTQATKYLQYLQDVNMLATKEMGSELQQSPKGDILWQAVCTRHRFSIDSCNERWGCTQRLCSKISTEAKMTICGLASLCMVATYCNIYNLDIRVLIPRFA